MRGEDIKCRRILVTGAQGFIGKHVVKAISEQGGMSCVTFSRADDQKILSKLVHECEFVIHLAGENRNENHKVFQSANVNLTKALCNAISRVKSRKIPLIFTSSIHAKSESPYGESKYEAEKIIREFTKNSSHPSIIYRLPGVFGKWCKPNYNSVVATFCHNIANNKAINIHDPKTTISLVHIDDVISSFIEDITNGLDFRLKGCQVGNVEPVYNITLEDLTDQIKGFKMSRNNLSIKRVGTGLTRALYSTYLSYLPINQTGYKIPAHKDERGVFVEMLKTADSGQFSYFTAEPGVTRGGHYHHTKTEKFLVLSGMARFKFRHIITGEQCELTTKGGEPYVVDTIPGWSHSVTNIGENELVVMLWANEVFNPSRPDTISAKV